MPLSFPSSPTNGQTYTSGSRTWTWNGTTWEVNSTPTGVASVTSSEIASGAVTQAKLASTISAVTICTSSTKPASPFDGQVIYMTDVDQTAVWDGTQWTVLAPVAGNRNKIINGDFKFWQRGSSLSVNGGSVNYLADRFYTYFDGNGTATVSRQSHTAGAAPATGYEGQYFHRFAINTVGTSTLVQVGQRVEDVRTLAGQTVTISFWAKTDSARTITLYTTQYFGSGGSSGVTTSGVSFSSTTAWQRFSATITLGSMSGKTIGDGSYTQVYVQPAAAAGFILDTWGWQLEAGAVATPFELEDHAITLAKCSRFCTRIDVTANSYYYSNSYFGGSATYINVINNWRATPIVTANSTSNWVYYDNPSGDISATFSGSGVSTQYAVWGVLTDGQQSGILFRNTAGTFIIFSAEF